MSVYNPIQRYQPAGAGAAELGSDVSAVPDLDPLFTLYTGQQVLGEAILRRLKTTRGGLYYAPNYGKDLRMYLNAAIDAAKLMSIKNDIERECENDERVLTAVASIAFTPATETLTGRIQVTTKNGPFRFVLSISAVEGVTLRAA